MNPAALRLLAWLSPAFPTGGYAYSHGLEWAVEAREIRDGATLRLWVEDVLRHGAGRSDAILLRHAHRVAFFPPPLVGGAGGGVSNPAVFPGRGLPPNPHLERSHPSPNPSHKGRGEGNRRASEENGMCESASPQGERETLASLTELALATAPARERRAEAVGQGNAFVAATAAWNPAILTALAADVGDIPYAIAVGAMAGANGIDEDMAAGALLQAFAANLISAAVRLVPLGQSAGLAVLAALEPAILDVAEETRSATLDDLGSACFRLDIAAMRHETQYTRLFRS